MALTRMGMMWMDTIAMVTTRTDTTDGDLTEQGTIGEGSRTHTGYMTRMALTTSVWIYKVRCQSIINCACQTLNGPLNQQNYQSSHAWQQIFGSVGEQYRNKIDKSKSIPYLFCMQFSHSLLTKLVHTCVKNDCCFTGLTKYGFDRFGFTPAGLDKDGCNYLYNGPYDVLHSLRIWELLSLQDRGFLLSVYRLCPSLDPVPLSWSRQFWAPKLKDVSGQFY